MHSLICVDQDFNPLSNVIIWADGRSSQQAKELKQGNGAEIYKRTGLPNHPMSPLSNLIWMKETDFAPYKEATYFISAKEYVIYKWFGRRLIDYAMASATGLFNMNTFDWDEEALAIAGIEAKQLSKIVPPTEILTGIDQTIAEDRKSTRLPVTWPSRMPS